MQCSITRVSTKTWSLHCTAPTLNLVTFNNAMVMTNVVAMNKVNIKLTWIDNVGKVMNKPKSSSNITCD